MKIPAKVPLNALIPDINLLLKLLMRKVIMLGLAISVYISCFAQKKWDGGGNNNQWSDAQNWIPDGIPVSGDNVILDNSFIKTDYLVELPPGNITVTLQSLFINPNGNQITVYLPSTNTGLPGMNITGTGDALVIGNGGILRNASGAASGNAILVTGLFRIDNGGKYLHQTARGNAVLIDRLSTAPGTEKGVFEFDTPGTAGYTVSLTSNTFGTLSFSAANAGGNKSYSGSGTGNLVIRGDLHIGVGAQLTSTLTADILLSGSLELEGRLNLNPVTTGSTGRSLKFLGKDQFMKGNGLLSMNANFRIIEITAAASLVLQRECRLTNAQNALINYGRLNLGTSLVTGPGKFAQADLAMLIIGDLSGINLSGDSGNIQTGIREFSKKSGYFFQGTAFQHSGTGLPDTISILGIDNSKDITLNQRTFLSDSLVFIRGNVHTIDSSLVILPGAHFRSQPNVYSEINAGWDSSFISGPVQMEIMDTGIFQVPIGASSIFAPLKLRKMIPGKMTYMFNYFPTIHPDTACGPALIEVSHMEYWKVWTDTGSFGGGKISCSYRPSGIVNKSSFSWKPAIYNPFSNPAVWNVIPGSRTGNAAYGWVNMDSSVTGFRDITIGFTLPDQVLPWRLIHFNAKAAGNRVEITWQADEDNAALTYIPEKSHDGIFFSGLGPMYSTGKAVAAYTMDDFKPYPGINYYRLCIISNSSKEYSMTIPVKIEGKKPVLYPNPVTDLVNIYFPDASSRYELEIVNMFGVTELKTVVNTVTCQIRVSNLRNGNYYVRLRHNNGLITLPFFKY